MCVMALYFFVTRRIYYCLRNISTSTTVLKSNNGKCMTLEVDSLDDFTSQLIQKKVEKWSTQKAPSNISLNILPEDDNKIQILNVSVSKINILFQEAIENNNDGNILELIEHCLINKLCPSISNLLYTLEICSQTGDITTIKKIKNLCKDVCPEIIDANSNFEHYIAEANWNKGNISKALNLFKDVYKNNPFLRRRIRLMLKNLIADIVTKRSEVVLNNVTKFAEHLAVEYKDFFALTCIWQTCFLSEWFTDQCLALDLLNKYSELSKAVINRVPYVVAVSLHNHQTEVVYRLLEILLKFEMKQQYSGVLIALLDYQIKQKDLRSCMEIIKWSEQNDIQLLPIHHQQYLKLLVNFKEDGAGSKNLKPKTKTKTHYKF